MAQVDQPCPTAGHLRSVSTTDADSLCGGELSLDESTNGYDSSSYLKTPANSTELFESQPGPEIPDDEMEILAKMEAQNKMIEQDNKSVSGKKSDSDSASQLSESIPGQQSLSEDLQEDLWAIWSNIVHNWDTDYKKRPQYIKDLCRRGIPSHFRTIAWQLISGANSKVIHEAYAEFMRNTSPHEKVIKRDISRTYPEHEFFRENHGRGQSSLFNVMKAYSLHDREVGYCQGSAFIAGLLLLQMPEEEAFAVLLRLMDEYGLRELYKPQMTQLGLCMFQLECLVQELMPDLHSHFQNMGLDASMYSSSWFLTLFSTMLPLELVNRIMDLFLCEGMEIIFRVSVAIMQLCRIDLLTLDMEGMLKHFQRDLSQRFENDHELLLNTAYQVKFNAKKMKKFEKDYTAKRSKEQEEVIELRRLRNENKILKQRVDCLEQESAALADRLLQGQVNFAQEAEACIGIKHELYTLRENAAESHRRLEEAYETVRELTSKQREGVNDAEIQADDTAMIETIHTLQRDLIETKTREADNEVVLKDLRFRLQESENANKRLREIPPDHCVASLQEELILVKMREAEASLSLKEMRQKISDLNIQWEKYIVATQEPTNMMSQSPAESKKIRKESNGVPPVAIRELQDQLMGVRIKEAETVAELKEMRQKVMELETQNHVCSNQIKRQDEEYKQLQVEYEDYMTKMKEFQNLNKEGEHRLQELKAQTHEKILLARLRETELLETIAELRNKLSELESKNFENWTQDQLNKSGLEVTGHLKDTKDDMDQAGTPNSLTNSTHSIGSEFDLNAAYLSEMAVKVPSTDFNSIPSSPTGFSFGSPPTMRPSDDHLSDVAVTTDVRTPEPPDVVQ